MDKWQRLSPYAAIHYVVKIFMAVIKNAYQGLIPLAAAFFAAGENRWFIIGLVVAGALALLLIVAVLSYLKFQYRIADGTVFIQSGVLKRKRLTLGFDRIQNVGVKEPIYFRPFGLVVVTIESAGSSGEEISLGGVPRSLAESIRAEVLNHKPQKTSQISETIVTTDVVTTEVEEIIHQPISELVRYGLTNKNVLVFFGIMAGFWGQTDWDEMDYYNEGSEMVTGLVGTDPTSIAIWTSLAVIGVLLVLVMLSVALTVITNYNYRLTRHDGRFHRTKGLFERQETSLLESKVQSIQISQGITARLLNRMTIHLKQVGFGGNAKQKRASKKGAFFIPSVEEGFSKSFSKIIYPNFNWEMLTLKSIDFGYVRKRILYIYLPITLIPMSIITLGQQNPWGLLSLFVPVIATPLVMLRRARYGYASDGEHGVVRSGFLGKRHVLFPFYKVQTVELHQSPGQRRRKLADLHVKLAGNTVKIPYVPLEDAVDWRKTILEKIESTNKAWM